tara:strand:- start:753 stop:983 length:231 start_codon:yes stop_codon:yes gene_type:complete
MGKYLGKNDFEKGTEFKVVKDINTSYGILLRGQKVTLIEVTHFPTSYRVIDENGKDWLLRTYDVEELEKSSLSENK